MSGRHVYYGRARFGRKTRLSRPRTLCSEDTYVSASHGCSVGNNAYGNARVGSSSCLPTTRACGRVILAR